MTKRAEPKWLGDIVAWGERLQRHIADVDRATFLANEVIQDAVLLLRPWPDLQAIYRSTKPPSTNSSAPVV
jgi:hypothetical protein